ncbi:MAG: restriction endonuclease subunit [Sporomusa sp.]|jgi:type I restriction enzyme S subunit|nr:restriction endonuclease subunit [Sporomusa sp.]
MAGMTPKVRFVGFSEEWQSAKLNAHLETSNKINLDGVYTKEDVLSVSGDYGIVNQIEFQGRSFAGASVLNYGIVETGDVVYTKSPLKLNPYGIIKANKGKPGIVSTLYAVYHPKDNTDPNFIQCYFESDYRLNCYLAPLVNKGAKNDMKVSDDNALLGNVVFPKRDEQVKVSEYLAQLDCSINAKKHKYEKLLNLKKSMLEKMFPKSGADVPEIRFRGFAGTWKRDKLEDIVTPYSDPVPTPSDGYFRLGIRSHGKGTFHNYVKPGMELETAQMHKVRANNLIFNITFAWEHAVAITNEKDVGKLVSHRFPQFSFNKGMIPRFFKFSILDDNFRHHLWLASPGGAGRNRVLKIDEMLQYSFWVPATTQEQLMIASYLENLGDLILNHQQELEKLQNLRKALLERMFV